MKKETTPHAESRVVRPPAKHQFEHELPTHIHKDPEEDMMLLARWTHRAMRNPSQFWGILIGSALGLIALVTLLSWGSSGSARNSDMWSQLESAKSAADRVRIAEENPGSPAAVWARLQAATQYYSDGFNDLPKNRDVALPMLKKALDNFDEVIKLAPKDSPQARSAAFGKARTLEARNELPKAIEQYQLVEKTWPNSAEAAQAKQLAAELQKPEAATFYKELYAYTEPKATLPGGIPDFNTPLVPSPLGGDASTSGDAPPTVTLPSPPSSTPTTPEAAPAASDQPVQAIPDTPFEDEATPAKPATEPEATPKTETPETTAPEATPKTETPATVAPATDAPKP